MVTRTCKHCGKEYDTFPAIRLQFCGAACANAHKSRKVAITCAVCGKVKMLSPSQSDQKYCSHSCAITARNLTDANPSYSRDVSGEKNPMYGKGFKGADNPMYGKRGEECPNWKGGRKVRKDARNNQSRKSTRRRAPRALFACRCFSLAHLASLR